MAANPPPSDILKLSNFRLGRYTVTYDGTGALSFLVDGAGALSAFAGNHTREITIDGRHTMFADQPMEQIGWAPVAEQRRVPNGAVLQIWVRGNGPVRIPGSALHPGAVLVAEGAKPVAAARWCPARCATAWSRSPLHRRSVAAGFTWLREAADDPAGRMAQSRAQRRARILEHRQLGGRRGHALVRAVERWRRSRKSVSRIVKLNPQIARLMATAFRRPAPAAETISSKGPIIIDSISFTRQAPRPNSQPVKPA